MAPGDLLEKGHVGLGIALLVALVGPLAAMSTGDLRLINTPLPQRLATDLGPKFINPRHPGPSPSPRFRGFRCEKPQKSVENQYA